MIELFGKSLARSWSEEATKWPPGVRRKLLVGTVIYGLGVLLQMARNFAGSPLFSNASDVVGVLMSVGVAIQLWATAARYHNSGRPGRDLN